MHETIPITLIQQMLDAPLEPRTQQLVLRLFTYTRGNTVILSKEQFMQLAGASSWNRARTYLTTIRATGLAHVATGDYICLIWLQPNGRFYPPEPRSEVINEYEKTVITSDQADPLLPRSFSRSEAITDYEEMPITDDQATPAASSDAATAPAGQRSEMISDYGKAPITTDQTLLNKILPVISDYGKAVITSDQPLRGKADPHVRVNVRSFVRTNDPLLARATNERTVGERVEPTNNRPDNKKITLLFCSPEVGLSEADALRLAADNHYEWLERQVFAWLNERQSGRVETTGALFSRIHQRFSAPALSVEDKASELYQRLHPNSQQEEAQALRRQYLPEQYKSIILH